MTANSFEQSRRGAWWVIGVQLLVTVLAALAGGVAGGRHSAWSAFLGGLINVVAGLYMLRRVFAGGPVIEPRGWFARLFVGEALKFGITVALFALAILVFKAAFLPLILAYIATFVAYWLGLLRVGFGNTA